jgi:DNA-binding NarL/FixJ family response regulator
MPTPTPPTFKEMLATVSVRERQVWRLIALGNTDKEIAAQLKIAHPTARVHRSSILKKMGARNAADLTRLAIKADLLRP